ncbi:hypothetical protein HZS_4761, partial [Henneguya salminicola]
MNELNLDVNEQQQSIEIQNESKDEVDESNVESSIIKNMNEAFIHLDKFLAIIEECDPNGERMSQVGRTIEKDTKWYKELYNEKKDVGQSNLLSK